jgi:hypothetical protein
MTRTTLRRTAATIALAATAVGVVVGASATGSAAATGKSDLARVQAATARFHDVAVAEAYGYVPVSGCEELPGTGAMGIHYLHPGLASDGEIVPTSPEILLYAPTAEGLRLVGVEYFVAEAAAPVPPSVLGRPLDGPMDGHGPGMPRHYDLHVWLWKHNPAGMTAPWNPALTCAGQQ